jgi:hypothetical protein
MPGALEASRYPDSKNIFVARLSGDIYTVREKRAFTDFEEAAGQARQNIYGLPGPVLIEV